MEEVLGLVRSSVTAPPLLSSPATAVEAELALPIQLPLEVVDETPTGAHDDMDLTLLCPMVRHCTVPAERRAPSLLELSYSTRCVVNVFGLEVLLRDVFRLCAHSGTPLMTNSYKNGW
jgi:hypothetical protein